MLEDLTRRELDSLRAYAETGSQKDAAKLLGITLQTLKNHLTGAYATLDVTGAIDAFRALGWLVVR